MSSALTSVKESKDIKNVLSKVSQSEEATAVTNAVLGPASMIGPGAALSAAISSVREVVGVKSMPTVFQSNGGLEDEEVGMNEDNDEDDEDVHESRVDHLHESLPNVNTGAPEHSGIFSAEITMFDKLGDAMIGDALDATMEAFRDCVWMYGNRWETAELNIDRISPEVSAELCDAIVLLHMQLQSASSFLCADRFRQYSRQVAGDVDNYLFQKVILGKNFHSAGVKQLEVDIRCTLSCFSSCMPSSERYFKRCIEAVTILSMDQNKLRLLADALKGVSEHEEQLDEMLSANGIFILTPEQVLVLHRQRQDSSV